jgi:ribosomal protein L11
MAQVREVAKQKMKDLNTDNLEAAVKTIAGFGALDGPAGGGVRP